MQLALPHGAHILEDSSHQHRKEQTLISEGEFFWRGAATLTQAEFQGREERVGHVLPGV